MSKQLNRNGNENKIYSEVDVVVVIEWGWRPVIGLASATLSVLTWELTPSHRENRIRVQMSHFPLLKPRWLFVVETGLSLVVWPEDAPFTGSANPKTIYSCSILIFCKLPSYLQEENIGSVSCPFPKNGKVTGWHRLAILWRQQVPSLRNHSLALRMKGFIMIMRNRVGDVFWIVNKLYNVATRVFQLYGANKCITATLPGYVRLRLGLIHHSALVSIWYGHSLNQESMC
jgi:hypothetical protein